MHRATWWASGALRRPPRPLAALPPRPAGLPRRGGPGIAAAFRRGNPRPGAGTCPRAARRAAGRPSPSTTARALHPALLDALAGEGVRATFFVLGRQAERHPEAVRRIAAEGHQLANHGYDHGILIFRGAAHVRDQLPRAEPAAAAAAGPDAMSPLFRAPHGFRGPATALAARRAGYRMAAWTRGVFDSAEPGPAAIARRASRALEPGTILLLHDADGWAPERPRQQTADALPEICRSARARELALVTLDELVAPA